MNELSNILEAIGEVGRRLADIEASEGAAGNISLLLEKGQPFESIFTEHQPYELPVRCLELAGRVVIASGSGQRLRELGTNISANFACVSVGEDGISSTMYYSAARTFKAPTSEFNTHLQLHQDFVVGRGEGIHTVVHAQPLYMTYLSHIPDYQNEDYLNRKLLRWQPECIVNLPEGIGVLPFILPGSEELMLATAAKMRTQQLVLWSKHGVIARGAVSVKKASDLIEYVETAAKYEYLNLTNHGQAEGLTDAEIRTVAKAYGIQQTIF